MPTNQNRVVREKLTNDALYRFCSRFEVIPDKALVAQHGRARLNASSSLDNNEKSPRWDLNPRPKVFAPPPLQNDERGITKPSPQQQFRDWLQSQGKTRWTIKQIKNYAIRYGHVLDTGDASALLGLSPTVRRHVLASLAALSKYQGCYDKYMQIKQRYHLKWTSSGNESYLQAFQGLLFSTNDELDFDSMLARIKEMIKVLPEHMGSVIKFNCLTGLRPSECIESVRLLNDKAMSSTAHLARNQYYNPERECLEHFRFPEIFCRRTKYAYVSFVTKEMLSVISIFGSRTPTQIPSYNAIRLACMHRHIRMDMRYCRKLFATHLRQSGISTEIIDALQGRMPASIFARHYYHPSLSYKTEVLKALGKLQSQVVQTSAA